MKAPTFPRYDTLAGRALLPLVLGEQITHRDFQNKTASYRLSSPIEVLRNDMHWPISGVWLEGLTKDKTGRRAKYKRYFINPEDLKWLQNQLGERLDNFISAVQRFEAGAATPTQSRTGRERL